MVTPARGRRFAWALAAAALPVGLTVLAPSDVELPTWAVVRARVSAGQDGGG